MAVVGVDAEEVLAAAMISPGSRHFRILNLMRCFAISRGLDSNDTGIRHYFGG